MDDKDMFKCTVVLIVEGQYKVNSSETFIVTEKIFKEVWAIVYPKYLKQ